MGQLDRCIGKAMKVESIDFLKSYSKEEHYLKTLVRIVDSCSSPIEFARVRITIQDPNGDSLSLSTITNNDGLAAIELSGISSGIWKVGVNEVRHPNYTLMPTNCLEPSRSTYV